MNKIIKTTETYPILIKDLGTMYAKKTSKHKHRYAIFKCGCGVEFKARVQSVKNGQTSSCGCKQRELSTTHGYGKHKLYRVWKSMRQRTSNPNDKDYKYYGEKGIKVCQRWQKMANFMEDMLDDYTEGLSLDRIDNNKGYSKENCRWTTREIQARNTVKIRSTNTSGYRGITKHGKKWQARIGVDKKHIHLGTFETDIEAAIAYDEYVIRNKLEHTINFSKKDVS